MNGNYYFGLINSIKESRKKMRKEGTKKLKKGDL